jgi:hypothetical protein
MSDEPVDEKARKMGWVPKEEWRGNLDHWRDAEEFVHRGEEILPILQANNRDLIAKVGTLENKLTEAESLLRAATESIEALKEFNSVHTRKEAKEKRKEIVEAIADARREGDVETEVALTEQLVEQTAAIKEAEKTSSIKQEVAETQVTAKTVDPAFTTWAEQNTWFGQDKRRSNIALAIANELRADPSNPKTGKAFYTLLTKELESTPGFITDRPSTSKVEGGRNGVSNGGGKSYSDLPAEAKAACDRQAVKVVGKGRAFKDINEWRKHYAETVLSE